MIHVLKAPQELPELVHEQWVDELTVEPDELERLPKASELESKDTQITVFNSGLAQRTIESDYDFGLESCFVDTENIIPPMALPQKKGVNYRSQIASKSKIDRRAGGFVAVTPKQSTYSPKNATWHNQAMRALLDGGKAESFCPSVIVNDKLKLCFDGGAELQKALICETAVPLHLFKPVCQDIESK